MCKSTIGVRFGSRSRMYCNVQKILVRQIIGPAAAGATGTVPTTMTGNVLTDHNVAHAHRYEARVVDLIEFNAASFVHQQDTKQQQHALVAKYDTCTGLTRH